MVGGLHSPMPETGMYACVPVCGRAAYIVLCLNPVCVCVCVCVYVCVFMCVCLCVCVYVCIHIFLIMLLLFDVIIV
jgi:hypothetical protein